MIDRRQTLLGIAGAWVAASPATWRAAPLHAATAFRPLFDGRSLEGWSPIGDAQWTVKEGMIEATGKLGFLLSRESFRDFDLRAEFWVSEAANSGIFIRCTDRAEITTRNAYEVNIFDQRPDPSFGTGAIVDVAKVARTYRTGGRWNVLLIRARGDRFDVTLNGEKTIDGARDATNADGAIALQYGAGVVKFRTVEIRPY